MSDAEFLEVGSDPRSGMSWRLRLALLGGALALVVVGLVVDRQMRDREQQAVEACADEVAAAVESAGLRVRAAYEYVRPSLTDPTPELQRSIKRLIARVAVGADAPLGPPRTTCSNVTVFPLHDDLQQRRDRCLAVLETQRAGLTTVAADGSGLGDWLGAPRRC